MDSTPAIQEEGLKSIEATEVEKRYGEEREKRLRDEGMAQFVDISLSEKYSHMQQDPWVDNAVIKDVKTMFPENRCQMLVLGAGWGGLLYAVRMIQAGIQPENIRIVDPAGGFGGRSEVPILI